VAEKVSARLDPPILELVEHVAAAERRPVSSLVRNIVTDWARAREVKLVRWRFHGKDGRR
jgi:hypothetical protein